MEEENNKKEDWEINIRSDLWTQMNTTQLCVQLELVLNQLALLSTLQASNPTVLNLHCALKIALNDLNELINNSEEKQKQSRRLRM